MSAFASPWFTRLFVMPPLVPLLVVALFVEGFWSLANLRTLLEAISADGLVVIGMTVVMIAGGFDLAVGAVLAMGGVAGVVLLPWGLPVAMAGAALAGAIAGSLSGALVTRLGINPFIATLAMMVMVRGATLAYTETRPVVSLDDNFLALAGGNPIPHAFIVLLAVMLIAHLLLTTRPWGRHVYALGGDERSAAMAGLPVSRLKMQCYMLSGLLAGFAGFLVASRLGTGSPIVGDATPLTAAAAALLGGASLKGGEGSIAGSFAGLLFVGGLINVMNHLDVPSYYQRMTIGGLLFTLVVAGGLLTRLRQR
jgi:ribose/xylose/arabinose/galactoside ABC-type transport system permease subunit